MLRAFHCERMHLLLAHNNNLLAWANLGSSAAAALLLLVRQWSEPGCSYTPGTASQPSTM
jgi:hypothetical protein